MYKCPVEEVVVGLGSGFVGLYMKVALTGEWFIFSRNWLALGGPFLPGQQGPKMSKYHKMKGMVNTRSNKATPPSGGVGGDHMGISNESLLALPAEKCQWRSGGSWDSHPYSALSRSPGHLHCQSRVHPLKQNSESHNIICKMSRLIENHSSCQVSGRSQTEWRRQYMSTPRCLRC